MLMCKMQSHLKAIKNILHLKAIKILDQKTFNAIMNYMGMNHSLHIGTYVQFNQSSYNLLIS